MELIKVLAELIEQSAQVCKLFVDSEVALNDGDTAKSVKCNKEGQQLFSTMTKDILEEVKSLLNVENNDTLDYDYPSVLELAKMLSELNYNAGRYINLVLENQGENAKEIVANKILTAINTSVEIYDCLFNN